MHRIPVLLAAGLLLPLAGGCMYRMEHRLPVDATFGTVRSEGAVRIPFARSGTKRYLLGGLLPWSTSFGSAGGLVEARPGRRVERLEIRTRFGLFDALLKYVPYASYLLAQRQVEVRGVYVDPVDVAGGPKPAAGAQRLQPQGGPPSASP